jgi:hypothetical protein
MAGNGRGGARPGSGPKPLPKVKKRSERTVVMLRPADMKVLRRLAREQDLPVGTVAHDLLVNALQKAAKRLGGK